LIFSPRIPCILPGDEDFEYPVPLGLIARRTSGRFPGARREFNLPRRPHIICPSPLRRTHSPMNSAPLEANPKVPWSFRFQPPASGCLCICTKADACTAQNPSPGPSNSRLASARHCPRHARKQFHKASHRSKESWHRAVGALIKNEESVVVNPFCLSPNVVTRRRQMLHKAERNVWFAQQQPLERSKLFRNSCHVGGCRLNEPNSSTPWMSTPCSVYLWKVR